MQSSHWLILSHRFPPQPAYVRVKTRRRLKAIGAVLFADGVHILPDDKASRAHLADIAASLRASGGEAIVFVATELEGGDEAIRQRFRNTLAPEFDAFGSEAKRLLEADVGPIELKRMTLLRSKLAARDFFPTQQGVAADAALDALRQLARLHPNVEGRDASQLLKASELNGRIWVTRRDIHVDRIASAWLIRRFIDPRARFKFVDPRRYRHQRRELRFDMANGEFTHRGADCSFEVLMMTQSLEIDAGLRRLAELIHELDVADGRYAAIGKIDLGTALERICATCPDDLSRIEQAAVVLDDLYRQLSSPLGST